MHQFNLQFHHVGLATRQPEISLSFLQGLGYTLGPGIFDPEQNVNLVLCHHGGMPDVEVVYPANSPGPLDAILSGGGESFYHFCYETADLTGSLASLKSSGHRVVCVSSRKPAALFGGRFVSFYRVKGFGLVELLEP